MFGLFSSKSEIEKLQDDYKKVLEKAHKMSHQNRTESDRLMEEAEKIANKIDELKNK